MIPDTQPMAAGDGSAGDSLHVDWAARLRVNPDEFAPLYHQLKERLRAVAALLEPGTLMPSERELIALTGVGRATARKAISDLVMEGLLYSQQGRGTFTARRRVETGLERIEGFTETMERLGYHPNTTVRTVSAVQADLELAEHLQVAVGDGVYVIERLRLIGDEPAMLEHAHLPALRFPGLLERDLTRSLYEILHSVYGVQPARGTESITAINADRSLASALGISVTSALLATVRTTESNDGSRIEHTIRHARGDLCSFRVGLLGGSSLSARSVTDSMFGEA